MTTFPLIKYPLIQLGAIELTVLAFSLHGKSQYLLKFRPQLMP